jgi:PilZ domain.
MNGQDPRNIVNHREYSRVTAYLPLDYKLVDSGQIKYIRSRVAGETILAEFKSLPDPDDQLIAEWLKTINTKLNFIIRMLTIQHEGFNCLSIIKVNISGGGISFNTGMQFKPRDILEMKVMLTMQNPLALFLYGEVVEVSKHNPEYDTSVQFIAIDDFIRDEIIRFVFEREREILREKRR